MTSTDLAQKLRDHYLSFGTFTYPGLYKQTLIDLLSDVGRIGLLVRKNIIHIVPPSQPETPAQMPIYVSVT